MARRTGRIISSVAAMRRDPGFHMRNIYSAALVVLLLAACSLAISMLARHFQEREPVDYEVRLKSPQAGDIISSPLAIVGQAHANWYSEGGFAIELRDVDGNVIATGMASAVPGALQAADGYSPFKAEMTFSAATGTEGVLILWRSNPKGVNRTGELTPLPN
jgi:hypothetical protein